MKIHLTESIFNRLLLTEATTDEIYQKYYTDIPYQTYCRILLLDPTYNNGRMGRYTKWLLNIYRKGTFKEGDFNEAIQLLPIYDRYKNVVPVRDIMTLNSMGELYRVVEPYMAGDKATSKSDAIRKTKEDAEKVYEDDKWLIVIPHTKEAAILYGKNTEWCTAAEESENMFDYYNNDGFLYINIDKTLNKKYQFHFESQSFMDEQDESIIPETDGECPSTPDINTSIADMIGMPPGAKKFYESLYAQGKKSAISIIYSPVEILQKLINDGINTAMFNMDVVNDYPANPGDVELIWILGWATFVKYRSSHIVESQVNGRWFEWCSEIRRLDKPIMTKNGACDEIAYAYEGDDKCMLIDKVGNFINDKVFKEIRHVFSNGYIVACYDLPSENKLNIFDLNNNCTPVFDEPFFRINEYYTSDGLMTAERYENGNIRTFIINVNGFEFDYSKFYEKVVKKYDYVIKNIIINVNEMIRRKRNIIDGDVYSYIAKELNKITRKVGDEISHVSLKINIMHKLKKDLYYNELFCKLPKLSPSYYG